MDKFIQGSTTVGTVYEAGLPNIKGTFSTVPGLNVTWSGAVTKGTVLTQVENGTYYNIIEAYFDASGSNSIYGSSDTVQPPALTLLYIIRY